MSTESFPSRTMGRIVRVWGQRGARTMPSTPGANMGPPAERLYAVEPVGVARIRAVRAHVREPVPAHLDSNFDDARHGGLVDDDIVEAGVGFQDGPVPMQGGVERHALLDEGASFDAKIEGLDHLVRGNLGQEAEGSQVDPEDGHIPASQVPGHRKESPVAAQHDHQVHQGRKLGALDDGRAGTVRQPGRLRIKDGAEALRVEMAEECVQRPATARQAGAWRQRRW